LARFPHSSLKSFKLSPISWGNVVMFTCYVFGKNKNRKVLNKLASLQFIKLCELVFQLLISNLVHTIINNSSWSKVYDNFITTVVGKRYSRLHLRTSTILISRYQRKKWHVESLNFHRVPRYERCKQMVRSILEIATCTLT
jgi:hypothetical protein